MELGRLEQLGQLRPVVNIIEAIRFILWMYPETRGLVATAYSPLISIDYNNPGIQPGVRRLPTHFNKGIENERLLLPIGSTVRGRHG